MPVILECCCFLLCLQLADSEAVAVSESLQMRSGDFLDSFQSFCGVRFGPEFDSFCPSNQKAASRGEDNAFPVRFDADLGSVSKVGYQLFAVASRGFGGNAGGGCVQGRHGGFLFFSVMRATTIRVLWFR
jgi:hypothetical protein